MAGESNGLPGWVKKLKELLELARETSEGREGQRTIER
jgi:hypothetical protein